MGEQRIAAFKSDSLVAERQGESEADLLDMSVVGSVDELLQFGQAIRFGQGKDELRLHVGFPGLLASHLQEFDQVLPVA